MDMDRNSSQTLEKRGAGPLTTVYDGVTRLLGLGGTGFNTLLSLAGAGGIIGGFGLGSAAASLKAKNPELVGTKRKREFYERKIKELDNENWLNDLMAARRKLETAKLSDEEREALEKEYIKLIDKEKD